MFTLLEGELEITCRGETKTARAGSTVNIPADAPHAFRLGSGGPAHLEACARETVAVWSYCLMPNHVHLILTPRRPRGSAGRSARRTGAIRLRQRRNRVTGHLFQAVFIRRHGRRASDGGGALRGDESGQGELVERAEDWPWSSARAHLAGRDDGLVEVAPLLPAARTVRRSNRGRAGPGAHRLLRAAETIGRPLGAPPFLTGSPRCRARSVAEPRGRHRRGARRNGERIKTIARRSRPEYRTELLFRSTAFRASRRSRVSRCLRPS